MYGYSQNLRKQSSIYPSIVKCSTYLIKVQKIGFGPINFAFYLKVKIQIIGGKVYIALLGDVHKCFVFKSLLTTPSLYNQSKLSGQ